MGREIERKFLPRSDAWRALARGHRAMRQGYLARGAATSVRARVAGEDAWLNIKVGGLTASRLEFEYDIPVADARELLAHATGPLIDKTRHYVEVEGFTFEVDEFHGTNAGLVVIELELEREDQPFPRPEWLGTEVTQHRRYYNVCLVEHPYSAWTEAERSA
jgi:adenylate cyclase